jgi:hypothetical protein
MPGGPPVTKPGIRRGSRVSRRSPPALGLGFGGNDPGCPGGGKFAGRPPGGGNWKFGGKPPGGGNGMPLGNVGGRAPFGGNGGGIPPGRLGGRAPLGRGRPKGGGGMPAIRLSASVVPVVHQLDTFLKNVPGKPGRGGGGNPPTPGCWSMGFAWPLSA